MMNDTLNNSNVLEAPQTTVQDVAAAIRDLPGKEREAFLQALGRDGILDDAALGAGCGPADHFF